MLEVRQREGDPRSRQEAMIVAGAITGYITLSCDNRAINFELDAPSNLPAHRISRIRELLANAGLELVDNSATRDE